MSSRGSDSLSTRGSDNVPSQRVVQENGFQTNSKITKVLSDSGNFDSLKDVHVLKHQLRSLEIDKLALMVDHNNLICEFNKSVETHVEEVWESSVLLIFLFFFH